MLRDGFYPEMTKKRIASDNGHMSNMQTAAELKRTMGSKDRRIFLAHLSENNNTPDDARQTVSDITGISRFRIDCLEFRPTRDRPGDTRTLTVRGR
jgi:phosphoribosyl 1,2-cyclic phosphodiesterase